MLLTVTERFVLVELLPTEDSYAGMSEARKTRANLALTDEESVELELKQLEDRVTWNPDKAQQHVADIPIGEWMIETIRGILREMNDNHKLKEKYMTLYEKFVQDYEQL